MLKKQSPQRNCNRSMSDPTPRQVFYQLPHFIKYFVEVPTCALVQFIILVYAVSSFMSNKFLLKSLFSPYFSDK
jgi:hypothetical protein